MRRARNVDRNQAGIVRVLRAAGATVEVTADVGRGFPDLVVGWRGRTLLFEVKPLPKRGEVFPSQAALNEREKRWHQSWRGHVRIIRSEVEALYALREVAA